MISDEILMRFARDAGLPVSWWDKAVKDGQVPPEWRELREFAKLVAIECIDIVDEMCLHSTDEWDRSLTVAKRDIAKRFGVEE